MIAVMVMLMLILISLVMASHILEVLSICCTGVVLGHGLAQGLGRDWVYVCAYGDGYGHLSAHGYAYVYAYSYDHAHGSAHHGTQVHRGLSQSPSRMDPKSIQDGVKVHRGWT